MFRAFFQGGMLFSLPLIAMLLFVAIFATVIVRVCQRSRRAEYDRMASLPLDDGGVTATRGDRRDDDQEVQR